MKTTSFLLLILISVFMFGCKGGQKGNTGTGGNNGNSGNGTPQVEFSNFHFGNYGGFTGQRLEYSVSMDGSVTLFDSMKGETSDYAKWNPKEAEMLFLEVDKLDLPNTNFNYPGNMSYFIGISNEDDRADVIWGRGDKTPPEGYQELYDQLISKTRDE